MTTTDNSLHLDQVSTAVPRPRRMRLARKIASVAGGTLAVFAIIAAAGAAYEQIAGSGDAAAYPPTGRLVDVGGHELHLDCRGQGTPTVVMDAGLGKSSLDWTLVQPELAHRTRVCTYDRAGMGRSAPGPEPRSPAHLADELRVLLQNGGVTGPYVLVAHSLAGKNARMFAKTYPADVVGMVLVDARSEIVEATADHKSFAAALESQAAQYSIARRFGIARLFGGGLVGQPLVPADMATQMVLAETNGDAIAATTQEGLARTADDEALTSANLGSMPLVVIAADESMSNMQNWPEAQNAMAKLSSNGRLVVANHSGHAVHLAAPNVVIDAVNDVLADVRNGL
ncbi:MAG: alpha/beta hydrolase [Devosia sp.]